MLGAGAWLGGIAAAVLPAWATLALVVLALLVALGSRAGGRGGGRPGGDGGGGGRAPARHRVSGGPVHDLASERAVVTAELTVTSDPRAEPRPVRGRRRVPGRRPHGDRPGASYDVRSPVVVLADEGWLDVAAGGAGPGAPDGCRRPTTGRPRC